MLIPRKQSGMVLLLAILIIATVLATAVAFSNLIIREIRQSRLIDQSIQAYYLAESGSERALYQIRRSEAVKPDDCGIIESGSTCDENPGDYYGHCSGAANQVSCITSSQGNLDNNVVSDWNITISNEKDVTVNLADGESIQVDLFSPYEAEGFQYNVQSFQVTSNLTGKTLYGEITNLTWLIGGTLNCPIDNTIPPPPNISKGRITIDAGLSPYLSDLEGGPPFRPYCSYSLRIGNVLLPRTGAGQFTISIYSTASNPTESDKLDIPSRLIIDSEAIFGDSLQKVRVKTPIRPPVSGLYDFVLFSEEEIVKVQP